MMEKESKQAQSKDLDNQDYLANDYAREIDSVGVESDTPHMSKNNSTSKKNSKKKNGKKAVWISVAALAFVGALFLGLYLGGYFNDKGNPGKDGNPDGFRLAGGEPYDPGKYKDVKMKKDISFYGFEDLNFKAGQTKQENCGLIQNPKENTSLMKVSLILDSGKDKGEVLWDTGNNLLEPGLAYNKIELKRPLEKGNYKAIVKYECYSVKDLSQQNGSEVAINLNVK